MSEFFIDKENDIPRWRRILRVFCIHYKDYYNIIVKVIGWVTYILLYRGILFIWVVNYFCFMYGVGKFYLQLLLLINIFNSNVVFFFIWIWIWIWWNLCYGLNWGSFIKEKFIVFLSIFIIYLLHEFCLVLFLTSGFT